MVEKKRSRIPLLTLLRREEEERKKKKGHALIKVLFSPHNLHAILLCRNIADLSFAPALRNPRRGQKEGPD